MTDDPKRLTVRLTPAVYDELVKHAKRLGLSKRAFIEQVLRGYMAMETITSKRRKP